VLTKDQKAVLTEDQQPIPAELQHEKVVAKPNNQPQYDLELIINSDISISDKQTELIKPSRKGFAVIFDTKSVL